MKARVLTIVFTLLTAAYSVAQVSGGKPAGPANPPNFNPPNLDVIVGQIRQAAQSANADIARLQIDRWKGDSGTKAQMQQVAESIKKNLTFAVPDLISDVQTSHGSVSSTFRLYHNLNVVYEFLSTLTDAASAVGKREEYEPLTADITSLDNARQGLSSYIEQAAAQLEKPKPAPVVTAPAPTPKKIIVDDDNPARKPATTKKKKTSAPAAKPSPTPQ